MKLQSMQLTMLYAVCIPIKNLVPFMALLMPQACIFDIGRRFESLVCLDTVPALPGDVDNRTIKYIWEGRYITDYDENQDENQVRYRVFIPGYGES